MPKKSTGYTPKAKNSSPIAKEAIPMKGPSMPNPLNGGANQIASLPGSRFPKLTKPASMAPRTPKV